MRLFIIRLFLLLSLFFSSLASAVTSVNLLAGWNLNGNSNSTAIDVAARLGDSSKITTVWKWDKVAMKWAFYAPSMAASDLSAYALSKGYDVLASIEPKEGFWVNASSAHTVVLTSPSAPPPAPGDPLMTLLESDLPQGWSLVSSADNRTPSELNAGLSSSLNAAGKAIITTWAWDAPTMKWRFYASSLEAQAGTALADYIASKSYLPFSTALSVSDGFWMNIGAGSGVASGTGQITIVKDAQPNDAQDFAFYAFGPNSGSIMPFLLDDDAGAVGADNILSNSKTFSNLTPGSYSVKEDFFNPVAVTGWDSTGIVCTSSTGTTVGTVDLSIHAFTVDLAAGDNVTCSFTNTKVPPASTTPDLSVIKTCAINGPQSVLCTVTVTNNGSAASMSPITLTDLVSAAPTDATYTGAGGTLPISCTPGAGPITPIACTANVSLAPGESRDALFSFTLPQGGTFTNCASVVQGNSATQPESDTANNTHICTTVVVPAPTGAGTGTLTIVKVAQPIGTQAFHFSTVGAGLIPFDLDDDGVNANPLSNSKTFTNLAAGIAFTVTEDAVNDWTVPSIQCLVAVPGTTSTFTDQLNRTFTVNLEAGANVTCTFTNVKTSTAFSAIGGPTLQVSRIAMIPTGLMTPIDFTSTTISGVTIANVTTGPTGVANNAIRTLANGNPGETLVGAVATLPSSITLISGAPALAMSATSCGGTSGGTPCPAGSLWPLSYADFGVWAINNVVGTQPANSLITYSAYAGGTAVTTPSAMPSSGTATYNGKMTGVLANTPVGGSENVSGDVVVSVSFANGTGTITALTISNIVNAPGSASTLSPCVYPTAAAACTYAVYAPYETPALSTLFGDVTLGAGSISGSGFNAVVSTPSVASASIMMLDGHFYGAIANEIAGTFTISKPSVGTPSQGMILIGSFGAK